MHARKLVAPILFTVITVIPCLAAWFGVALSILVDDIAVAWPAVAVGVPFLICAGISVYVLIERINEIRSGEEDDLSKY